MDQPISGGNSNRLQHSTATYDLDQPESDGKWSSLPGDLLSLILDRLGETDTDRCRLCGVCSSWRCSLLSSKPPLQFPLEDSPCSCIRRSVFYLISPKATSSSNPTREVWLTRVEEKQGSINKWNLQNPLAAAFEFNPIPKIIAKVNFMDYSICEVARSLAIFYNNGQCPYNRVVMLPKRGATDETISVLALGLSDYWRYLILWNPEAEDWIEIKTELPGLYVDDIIAYQGRFYATDKMGRLLAIDPMTLDFTVIVVSSLKVETCGYICSYLVESSEKLYLVIIDDGLGWDIMEPQQRQQPTIKVFILGESHASNHGSNLIWEPVLSLGDRIFFISEYVTFSLSAKELGWSQGNCIIFILGGDFMRGEYGVEDFRHDPQYEAQLFKRCRLYTLEDGSVVTGLSLPAEIRKLFWPVPSWLDSQ